MRFCKCSSRCAAGAPRPASRRGSIASRCAARVARTQEDRSRGGGGSGARRIHPGGPVKIVVPVEQLDEERLVNIERRIVLGARIGEARSARRSLAFAAAAVCALAGGVIGWQLHRTDVPAPVPAPAIAMHGATLDL